MDQNEYSKLAQELDGKLSVLSLDFMDLGILLGGIRMMLEVPEVEDYSPQFHRYIENLRGRILRCYETLGLDERQIRDLDEQWALEDEEP